MRRNLRIPGIYIIIGINNIQGNAHLRTNCRWRECTRRAILPVNGRRERIMPFREPSAAESAVYLNAGEAKVVQWSGMIIPSLVWIILKR